MLIYLAHSKTNYSSLRDQYVVALRDVEHPQTLYSFVNLTGKESLPVNPSSESADDHLHGDGPRT